jgi:hypothetical protein
MRVCGGVVWCVCVDNRNHRQACKPCDSSGSFALLVKSTTVFSRVNSSFFPFFSSSSSSLRCCGVWSGLALALAREGERACFLLRGYPGSPVCG